MRGFDSRFEEVARNLKDRRLSRRSALVQGAGGLAGGAAALAGMHAVTAQDGDATPAAETGDKTMYLFVQTFQGGSIVPTEGAESRYTVTLDAGTGQTVYFGDRPSRDVGVTETPQFLEGLGFPEDNPPNAALIVETEPGETDIAVVELFNPLYDPLTQGVTYDVEVLANWQQSLEMEFTEAPTDLAELAPSFGTAHLLIDDCPQTKVWCEAHGMVGKFADDDVTVGTFNDVDSCWNYSVCMPCEPYGHVQPDGCATKTYWTGKCNEAFPACKVSCWAELSWPFANWGC